MNSENILFRAARSFDISDIIALLADDEIGLTREDTNFPIHQNYLDAFQAIEQDPNQHLVVVTQNEKIIGTLQLTFIPGLARKGAWRGQIEAVRIALSHRGAGIGEQMFHWAIEQCKQKGCRLVQLTTDKTRKEAHNFYEKLGFVDSHIGYKMIL